MSTIITSPELAMQIGPYRRHELLGGVITYPVQGYDGYGDGRGRDLREFITVGMSADWAANREALLEFWRSGGSDADAFPDDTLPWLCTYIAADRLPWACRHLD